MSEVCIRIVDISEQMLVVSFIFILRYEDFQFENYLDDLKSGADTLNYDF